VNDAAVASMRSATIVVLEENGAVEDLIDQALRECGHRVLTTQNALEALEVVRRVKVDVLVVGVLLGERGHTLAGEFRSIQYDLRIVSISSPGDELQGIEPGALLSSPFSLDDLLEAVEVGLDRG
jgi:DNA-binding response OmpR family regulator